LPDKYIDGFRKLVEIIDTLRGPEGCPWDKKQTHKSLREYLLKESYEVLEALDEEDSDKLCQELGDLLLQIVLHTRISTENGEFKLEDVLHNINTKLIRRHPHVFGDSKAADASEVSHNWELIKKAELEPGESVLNRVPRQLPALVYSQEIQRRAAKIGFDWENLDGVIDKLVEEVKEIKESSSQEEQYEEFGDLLFTLVNVARRMDIDPEGSLRQANFKFYRRFKYMEEACQKCGLDLDKLSLEEQNMFWEESKKSDG